MCKTYQHCQCCFKLKVIKFQTFNFQVILARYVRLIPVTWGPSGPGLRLNYIACFTLSNPTPRPTVPFGVEPTTRKGGIPTPQITGTTFNIPTLSPPTPPVPPTLEPCEYEVCFHVFHGKSHLTFSSVFSQFFKQKQPLSLFTISYHITSAIHTCNTRCSFITIHTKMSHVRNSHLVFLKCDNMKD